MSLTKDFSSFDSRNASSDHPSRRAFPKSWGAEYLGDGEVLFRLWAPDVERLRLRIAGRNREMLPAGQGWFTLTTDHVEPGTPYQFLMADGNVMPDPASRAQAGGIDGPSLIINPTAYQWAVTNWRGHAWEDVVLHEVQVGTFTREGTFRAAIGRLKEIVARGVTMLQVNQLPADYNEGGGGALPYAPHHAYGTPSDMKAFIDAAHRHGLSVMLDVVWDHVGLQGSLLDTYVPSFFDPERALSSRRAINFTQPPVRQFFIENALYWLEEYNLDGLRLDAVNQLDNEDSGTHFLTELAQRVRLDRKGRPFHLLVGDDRDLTHALESGQ